MDLTLLALFIVISLPFVVLAYILQQKRASAQAIDIDEILTRAGIHVNQEENVKDKVFSGFIDPLINLVETRIKRAGLQGPKVLLKLVVAQVVFLLISFVIVFTQTFAFDFRLTILAIVLPLLPALFVFLKQRERQELIKSQFPEMLDSLVRSLQSGHGIDGSLSIIAKEFPDPLGSEIKEVSDQLQIGISIRDILREFQRRVTLSEAQYFVITLIIQRETGGQLSVILDDLSKMMRRRERFQSKLKTLTAESRFTSMFIGGVPILYLAYKFLFAIETMEFFLYDPVGKVMLWVSVGLIFAGIIILRQMMKIRF